MKKRVRIRFSGPGVQAGLTKPMGFWRFMLECVRFWCRRRTSIYDFDMMVVSFTEEKP